VWIAEWEWDDINVGHLAERGLTPEQVSEVWHGNPKFRRNKKHRAASHQMIGADAGGAFYAIFVRQSETFAGRWRAITGRPAEQHETDWWKKS